MRMWLLAAAMGLAACGTGAVEWRPANSGAEYAAVDDAYRIREAGPECDRIGFVLVSGNDQLGKIARASAQHGGTHYVIVDERMADEIRSHGSGTYSNGYVETSSVSRKVRVRDSTTAAVYRCSQ